ncbi:MAG: sulfatase-like hydrolase/transferase, partial [Planctomycetota bacterium]
MHVASILACGLLCSAASAQTSRPLNVLYIMDDQHNPRMLGLDSNGFGGVPVSLTPNLDLLAAQGVRFSHAYTSAPQCMPERLSLLTGRFPHEHGLRWNNIWEPARGELTLPALARRHGYFTGTIGKNHLFWLDQPDLRVTDHGFDRVQDRADYVEFCGDNGVPPYFANGNHWRMDGISLSAGYTFNTNRFHTSGYFSDQAIDFLENRAGPGGDGKPFVLWLSFDGPHPPILPSGPADPNDWAHRYHPFSQLALPANLGKVADTSRLQQLQAQYAHMSAEEHREALSYYYGLVSQIDFNIGRVLTRLGELGLDDRTVVVFTADHGEYAGEMACWTKGGGS